MKLCTKCNKSQSLSNFSKNKAKPDGLQGWCKDCMTDKRNATKQDMEEYHKNYRKDNKVSLEDKRLRRLYGITLNQKKSMVKDQQGKCAICELDFKSKYHTHVDHCHTTGEVRGILCSTCNTGLGKFRDSTKFLNNAIEYLIRYNVNKEAM